MGQLEEVRAHFTFERGAGETAANFDARAAQTGFQIVKLALDAAHIGDTCGAEIEHSACAFGDNVGARAAFDHAGDGGDRA